MKNFFEQQLNLPKFILQQASMTDGHKEQQEHLKAKYFEIKAQESTINLSTKDKNRFFFSFIIKGRRISLLYDLN